MCLEFVGKGTKNDWKIYHISKKKDEKMTKKVEKPIILPRK